MVRTSLGPTSVVGCRCDDRRACNGSSSSWGVLPRPADRRDSGVLRCCELTRELLPALAMRAGRPVRSGGRGHGGNLVHSTGRAFDRPCPGRPALAGPCHERPEGLARLGGAGPRRSPRAIGCAGGFDGRPRVRAALHFAKAPPGHRGGDTRGPRRAWHRLVRGARLRLGFGTRARRSPSRRRPRLRGPRRRIARLEEPLPARPLARCRVARRTGGARGRRRGRGGGQQRPERACPAALSPCAASRPGCRAGRHPRRHGAVGHSPDTRAAARAKLRGAVA